jgi:arylsulfatase A-like enzyme
MIVRWPGRVRPGQVSDHVWAHWDFLPTAAALAGIQEPSAPGPPASMALRSSRPTLGGRRSLLGTSTGSFLSEAMIRPSEVVTGRSCATASMVRLNSMI